MTEMNHDEIQKKVEAFLKELGVPSFIVFGWQKAEANPKDENPQGQFGIVSSYHEVPNNVAIKGMSWALNDFVNRTL